MSDIAFSDLDVALILLAAVAPGLMGGALIGAVAWRGLIGKRWWIGSLLGAVIGAVVWFLFQRYT